MAGRGQPGRVVYLELLDSLLSPDGGHSKARQRLFRDFPWMFTEGWNMERWGLRRRGAGSTAEGLGSVRGITFPLRSFPRVLLPVVVWVTQFVQLMLRRRAGILIAYGPLMGTGAAAARVVRRKSSRLVIRIINDFSARNRDLYGKERESRILQRLERFVLKRADLVLPMGASTHEIAARAGVSEERIVELPHPARRFDLEAPAEDDGPVRVVAAGRMVPEKGFDVLIAAFGSVAEEFPDVLLEVAGDGPQRAPLQSMAASMRVLERVRFRGWIPAEEMPGFYSGALVAVLPSRINEGLGMVLVEAGLAGCALVGSDVGGIRDIVRPDRTGMLVPPNDPAALSDALRALLGDPQKAKRLGAGAHAEARAYIEGRDDAVRRVRDRITALQTELG